jgi:5-methylcytosine-specific restriction endonuclease McrA
VIENMFCEGHNLQVLCKDCHGSKTKEENAGRKESLTKGISQTMDQR